jgi:hypothetical protein
VGARAGSRPTRPASREWRGDGAVSMGPRARGWGADGVERVTGGGKPAGAGPPVRPCGGSLPGFRFCDGGVVARHRRGSGIMAEGPIWSEGA